MTNGLLFLPSAIFSPAWMPQPAPKFTGDVGIPITDRTYASPLVLGDRILVVTRMDGAMVFAASRDFELLAHNKIEGDGSLWNASPAVSE